MREIASDYVTEQQVTLPQKTNQQAPEFVMIVTSKQHEENKEKHNGN